MKQPTIHISIITVFPELHEIWAATSLLKRAGELGIVSISTIRLADMVAPKERIDTPTCGPGPGMVLKASVVSDAIDQAQQAHGKGKVVFFSPSGAMLNQRMAQEFVADMTTASAQADTADNDKHHLILVCARYEGVDCRVEQEYADHIISIGNYVLMGGDVPAQVFIETVLRFFPGVLGNEYSLLDDSFTGPLVDYPCYGQPKAWRNKQVPEVLLSGDHGKISQWREAQALRKSVESHFAWLRSSPLPNEMITKVANTIPPHYVILMHDQVMVGKKEGLKEGQTSVTTIDLHDIARSSATYGIEKFFIVTPLYDQQRLLRVFFQFWQTAQGKNYNINRYDAMSRVRVVSSIEQAEQMIMQEQDGNKPLRIATSAQQFDKVPVISYDQQEAVWPQQRPVSLVFGTGQGLTDAFMQSCDYLLVPVRGFSNYNHLSVRSAVAIILDRWLGYQQPADR